MKDIEDLLKIGIKPTEELNTVERTEVIKKLAMLMSNNINTFKYSENENYMRLFNLNIMYAEFDQADNEIIYGVEETKKAKYKYNGVYYSENNNILFLTKDYDIENIYAINLEELKALKILMKQCLNKFLDIFNQIIYIPRIIY